MAMTPKDIESAFDDILKKLEEEKDVVEEPQPANESAIEESKEEPVYDFTLPSLDSEELKSPSESVDELLKPILEEKTEDPLIINFDERSKTVPEFSPITVDVEEPQKEGPKVPSFEIPEIVVTDKFYTEDLSDTFTSYMEKDGFKPITVETEQKKEESVVPAFEIPNIEKKPKMPDMKTIKEKSVGEVVVPKKAKFASMATDLLQKKKSLIKKIVALIAVAGLMYGTVNYAIEQGYKTPSTKFGQFVSASSESKIPETDLGDVGIEIANKITTEMQEFNVMNTDPSKQYDANKAVLQVFGSIYKQIVRTLPYTKKGTNDIAWGAGERNDNWLTYMYDVMQYHLKADGTINLPETLEEYLAANGLNRGKMTYNSVTNKLRIEDSEEPVSYYQSLDNLKEYSDYLIGRTPNPAIKVAEEYTEKYLELQNMYPDYLIRLSHDGIKLYANHGATPVYDVVSLNPIVLVETQKNINEEGVTSARN